MFVIAALVPSFVGETLGGNMVGKPLQVTIYSMCAARGLSNANLGQNF